jgi:hypothetical protein
MEHDLARWPEDSEACEECRVVRAWERGIFCSYHRKVNAERVQQERIRTFQQTECGDKPEESEEP